MGVVEVALGLAIASAIAGTATSVYQAGEQKSAARKNAAIQKQQAQQQERLNEVRRRRQARIAKAVQTAKTGGEGVGGSIVTAPMTAIDASLQGQSELSQQGLGLTMQSIENVESQSITQANVGIATAVGNLAQQGASIYGQYQQGSGIQNQINQYETYIAEQQPNFVGPPRPNSFYDF